MGDSESFTSLMDLVNSHLSKTSLNTSQSGDEGSSAFPLASVRVQTGLSQTVFTPPNGIMSIPRLGAQDNEINGILAQQVTNMLIAKEKKKQEEEEKRQRRNEKFKILKQQMENDYVIDLMSCIVVPKKDQMRKQPLPVAASTSSSKSLQAEVKALCLNEPLKVLEPKEVLPLNRDVSHMLYDKVRKGRPSAFGKVISSRVRPVAAPYFKLDVNNPAVQRFDFSTQSPCDINLEKRRRPPLDPYAHMNMVERFMATDNETVHHV